MREIKFRAWDETKKLMLTVTDIAWDYRDGKGLAEIMCINPSGCEYDPFEYRPEHVKLLQFTGLKDCEGREIYEGDIIKLDRTDCIEIGIKLHVDKVRRSETGGYHVDDKCLYKCRLKKCEVIGNIYENPELLNQELEDVED